MAQATTRTYRILVGRQRHRHNWLAQGLTERHRVAYDPEVYGGAFFPLEAPYLDHPAVEVINEPELGHPLGLFRRSAA